MPPHAELMARSFPALLRAGSFAADARVRPPAQLGSNAELNPLEQRNRAFIGLRDLLAALCARQPVVFVLDDMHWIDNDSLSLLRTLLTGPSAPALAVLATLYPEEERVPEHTASASELRRLLGSSGEPLLLGGLDARAGRLLAEHLLTPDPPPRAGSAESIAQEAGGHPQFIEQWIELLKEGAPQTGRATLSELVRERLAQLRPAAVQLAVLVGLSELPVPLNVLAEAAGLSAEQATREAATLRLSRLCRITQGSDGERLELSHDRVRDALLAPLDDAERARRHAALARAYAALQPHDHEALGNHLQLSGEPARAAECFASAADRAFEALAFARAARLYGKSIALTGEQTSAERHARLGDALTSWGRAPAGARAYLAAAQGSDAPSALDLRRRAMEQLLVSGHFAAGQQVAAQLLPRLRISLAATRFRGLLRAGLRWTRLRITGFGYRERDASALSAEQLLRVDTAWSLFVGFSAADMARAHDPLSLHLVLALRAGEPLRIGRALAGFAFAFELTRGQTGLAQELIERAEAISERIDHPYLRGLCHLHAGSRAFHAGHDEVAKANLERAERAFQTGCRGRPWELATTHFLVLLCHVSAGDVRTLSRLAKDWHEEALARDDLATADDLRLRVLPAVALLEGDVDAACRLVAAPPAVGPGEQLGLQAYWRECCMVECDLYEGRGAEALARVQAFWPRLQRSSLSTLRVVHLESHWLRARAALMALDDRTSPVDPQRILADATEMESSDMGGAAGLGWAVRGGLAQHQRDLNAARTAFQNAERELSIGGRLLVAKLVRLRRGLLCGDPESDRARREAELWLSGAGIANATAMVRVLVPGGLRS
jgi:hypothetical protein